jgi:butyryl-CoA:acetate CoA-transferase
MGGLDEYREKLVTAEQAARVVRSGDWVEYGSFLGMVRACDKALAARKGELSDVKVRSCVTAYAPEVILADPAGESFSWHSWHFSGADRKFADKGVPVYYTPVKYSEVPKYVRQEIDDLDVFMLQVHPMDRHGFFNFGPQCSHSKALCDRAKTVIVEVNEKMPRCLGGYEESIHLSEVDFIVEGDNPPLTQLPSPPPTDVDRKVADFIVEEMSDGCCIQLGIGGMPNAVGMGIADSDLKELGCHTEMLVDAYVHMFNAGKLTGTRKQTDPGKIVFTFALGTQLLYDFIDDNPRCATYPVSYTNRPSIASRNDNLVTINNAIEVDLYGQVCSESSGFRQITGTGGQLDFVLAGYESRGGKSIICLPSSYKDKEGKTKSRIVPFLPPGGIVTAPRTLSHIMVTEYGKFNMKGQSVWQRAEGLIGIAHPDTREELIKAAESQGIWRRNNRHG